MGKVFFYSIWIFYCNHSWITGLQGKGEGISLTPHCHFHPVHRHLDISWAITAESSPLHIASSRTGNSNREPLVSERKSLTTKLRALDIPWIFFWRFPIQNHPKPPITEKRRNKAKYLARNFVRLKFAKKTSIPKSV